eukprot:3562764-Alexandrium_andersonii.AAC.1
MARSANGRLGNCFCLPHGLDGHRRTCAGHARRRADALPQLPINIRRFLNIRRAACTARLARAAKG